MKYVNEYTIGTAATVAGTALQAYLTPAALTVKLVAGFGLLSLASVAISYTAFLGAKAAYNYFKGEKAVAKTTETVASRTRSKTKQAEEKKTEGIVNKARTSAAKAVEAAKTSAAKAVEAAKTSAANAVETAKETTSSIFTTIGNGLNSAWNTVKGVFVSSEAAKPEAAKPEAKKVAEEAVEVVAEKAAAKAPITPTFAAKKAAAKKAAPVAAIVAKRPQRNVARVNYKGM